MKYRLTFKKTVEFSTDIECEEFDAKAVMEAAEFQLNEIEAKHQHCGPKASYELDKIEAYGTGTAFPIVMEE